MKKVLIVITTDFASYGGLTTVMMNYYRHIDKTGLQIDFASTNDPEPESLEDVYACGGRYFNLGERKGAPLKYLWKLMCLLRKEHYDVIHVNGNSATMAMELVVARMCGVKTRIAHGHTTQSDYPRLHNLLAPIFAHSYTKGIATSKATGEWLYGEDYLILNNAIDIHHYGYSPEKRAAIRERLQLKDHLVVGTVGKLMPSKNHTFLIDIFREIYQKRPDAMLVIAGGGDLEEELKQQCRDYGLEDKVIFMGMLNDVSEALQAFDVFVFTSKYEGLGMALIEAQASGLPCISADAVPMESKVSEHAQYISLSKSASAWADIVLECVNYDRQAYSDAAAITIKEAGYAIQNEAIILEKIYKEA